MLEGQNLEARLESGPLSLVVLVEDQRVDEPFLLHLLQESAGTIGGPVIDDDHLQLQGHLPDAAEEGLRRADLVIRGNHDGDRDAVPGKGPVLRTRIDDGAAGVV